MIEKLSNVSKFCIITVAEKANIFSPVFSVKNNKIKIKKVALFSFVGDVTLESLLVPPIKILLNQSCIFGVQVRAPKREHQTAKNETTQPDYSHSIFLWYFS